MPSTNDYNLLKLYLEERHVQLNDKYLQEQFEQCPEKSFEQIYQNCLKQNWDLNGNQYLSRVLPAELNKKLFNIEKKTFFGKYLLQISDIIDISKPMPFDNQINNDDSDDNDSGDDNNENEDFGKLFKKRKHPSDMDKNKKNQKFFRKGPRMLNLSLTDGHNHCVGIEYQSIPELTEEMIGSKILLLGPFDVHLGVIFLQNENIKIIFKQNLTIHNKNDMLKEQELMEITDLMLDNMLDFC